MGPDPSRLMTPDRETGSSGGIAAELLCLGLTILLAFLIRLLEWPCWQNPEYRLGNEMLLATHDAYHWLAGAEGFGLAKDHPMSVFLRFLSSISGIEAANMAFWLPAVMTSLVAGLVQIWCRFLGSMTAGIAAGLIASISPGFLARTLLGYYDTDLVTLFFPLLVSLLPAVWTMRFMLAPGYALKRLLPAFRTDPAKSSLPSCSPPGNYWIILLALAGLASFYTMQWHSVFPYLVRYNIFLLAILSICLAPPGRTPELLVGSLFYAFPAVYGFWGLALPLSALAGFSSFLKKKYLLAILWGCILFSCIGGDIVPMILNHMAAYIKSTGDIHSSGGASLVFPSVAQSIIEVQDLSLAALFPYFHPWYEAAIIGTACFFILLLKKNGALFLLPLALLAFASSKLGGRMVMFGAPVLATGLTIPLFWILARLFPKFSSASGVLAAIISVLFFVIPFLDMVPALSQGPSINRRQAAALLKAREITTEDSMLWIWWDWGYAAHYFARRNTIADGAQHSGPSLYLPAAVFASQSPRFGRQVIRYASQKENIPGNFFSGLNPDSAQNLINRLRSPQTPLIHGKGKQYIITSFEMLKLGFWISNFGNWNFITKQGEGGALSILPQALSYRLNGGEVRIEGNPGIILPSSITIFEETGLIKRNYIQEWFASHPEASPRQQAAWLSQRRNINFLFNKVTDEKLAMDEGIFDSLMVRLLICDPQDNAITPYYKLVYDNVFTRIYEVLPLPGESSWKAGNN